MSITGGFHKKLIFKEKGKEMEGKGFIRGSIRFNSNLHVQYRTDSPSWSPDTVLNNISIDGLCFNSENQFNTGSPIKLQIPVTAPTFKVKARVVWSKQNGTTFDTGVKFVNIENGYRIKAVEQVCLIEEQRKRIFFEGGQSVSMGMGQTNHDLVNNLA